MRGIPTPIKIISIIYEYTSLFLCPKCEVGPYPYLVYNPENYNIEEVYDDLIRNGQYLSCG